LIHCRADVSAGPQPAMDDLTDTQLHRLDPLTGCGNLLGFLDWLSAWTQRRPATPASLLALDVNRFADLNAARGHAQGDAALHWVALVVADAVAAPLFRTGGDEFVVVLADADLPAHVALSEHLFARLNREAGRVGLGQPAVTVAVVHYTGRHSVSLGQVLSQIESALIAVKRQADRPPTAFDAATLEPPPQPERLLDHVLQRMLDLGARLDESHRLALSDPLTGLPNVRAAAQRLEAAAGSARPLAVLLLDGDYLRLYNDLGGYAAGDRMIQDLGQTLQSQLRPGDFLARWRVGDEFLVLLPDTGLDGARTVGERLCLAVRETSRGWLRPVSVSIGLAARPAHGEAPAALLAAAEAAKDEAKAQGRDRLVVAPLPPRPHPTPEARP